MELSFSHAHTSTPSYSLTHWHQSPPTHTHSFTIPHADTQTHSLSYCRLHLQTFQPAALRHKIITMDALSLYKRASSRSHASASTPAFKTSCLLPAWCMRTQDKSVISCREKQSETSSTQAEIYRHQKTGTILHACQRRGMFESFQVLNICFVFTHKLKVWTYNRGLSETGPSTPCTIGQLPAL